MENIWSLHNFIKSEARAQVFSCEFCEILKKHLFYRTALVAASFLEEYVDMVLGRLTPEENCPYP